MSARESGGAPAGAPCAHTAALADAASADLATVIAQLGDLIGNGNRDGNALTGVCCVLSRVGAIVEMVAKAHGGHGWGGSPMDWMFDDKLRKALEALEPVAQAHMDARIGVPLNAVALAEGGAA